MTVIAEVSIPAEGFQLGRLLEVRPGVQVRFETSIPTGQAQIPYVWVRSPDVDAVEAALRETPVVGGVTLVDRVGDESLFRVDWAEDVDGVVGAIRETDGAVLGGRGHGDHWTFQLRFPDTDELSRFYRAVLEKGIPVDLEGVHDPVGQPGRLDARLSAAQREALALALEAGYFAVPREITLVELADRLDISDSAASQRIRRGLSTLLSSGVLRE